MGVKVTYAVGYLRFLYAMKVLGYSPVCRQFWGGLLQRPLTSQTRSGRFTFNPANLPLLHPYPPQCIYNSATSSPG